MKKCESCQSVMQLNEIKAAFFRIFMGGAITTTTGDAITSTGDAITSTGDEVQPEKKKRITNQTASAIQKIGYQQGYVDGKAAGFGEGLRFYRRDEKIINSAVRDTAIQAYIDETLDIGGPGRMNSTELYARFKKWFLEKKSDAECPNMVIFGRDMGRILRKQKSNGNVFYLGVKLKENQVDSSVLI